MTEADELLREHVTNALDVVEACADSLLAAAAMAMILQLDDTADHVPIESARKVAITAIDRVIARTVQEGARPRE